MNSIDLINTAIDFYTNTPNSRKRVGVWLQELDMDGLNDLQEKMTEVMYENQGDDSAIKALIYLREYIDAEFQTKGTKQIFQFMSGGFKKLFRN